ncbi:MAG TPA: 4,5-DOPA dioxygenase extradiol, partial [Pantoea sp.]|nr:4,5-DOPA dioxygenase extradiol [Pantoea sp.]
ASSFEQFVPGNLASGSDAASHPLVNFLQHPGASLSTPTPEHYLPLLYVLGTRQKGETISIPVDGMEMGAISMLSVQVG